MLQLENQQLVKKEAKMARKTRKPRWGKIGAPHSRKRKLWMSKIARRGRYFNSQRKSP